MSKVSLMRTPVSKVPKPQPTDFRSSGSNPFDSDSDSEKNIRRARMVSKVPKPHSTDFRSSGSNPFDSDSDSETNIGHARTSSAPTVLRATVKSSPSGHNEDGQGWNRSSASSHSGFTSRRNIYENDFRDSGGLENQSVQELETYAVYKAEETTQMLYGARKIAEEIREDATKTLVTLHQQGEQITRTHMAAADIEHDLSRGEKLLGSLGGIFSKKWKPQKGRPIKGPVLARDDSFKRKGSHMEQRERLGLSSNPKGVPSSREYNSEPTSSLQKVEFEKAKQDDALSDLSNLLDELKEMAVDMGTEIGRQTIAVERMQDDVDELNNRVKGANARGRRLLGK